MKMPSPIRLSVRAMLIRDGHILLNEHSGKDGYWYMTPGGGVEHNETLAEALVREIEEECGLTIEPGRLLFEREVIQDREPHSQLDSGFHQVELFYAARIVDETKKVALNLDEDQLGHRWVCLEDLPGLTVYPRDLDRRLQKLERLSLC